MLILALDLGKFKSVACVLDTETNKHWFQTMETTPERLGQFLREAFSELMVIEACSLAGWVADLCGQLNVKLRELSKSKTAVQRLMKIKGVGEVAAQTIVAWLDKPKRFRNARQVSAYAGLVPRRYQSGRMDRSGQISKRGPKWLRSVLVEVAWIVVRYNDWAQAEYQRIHRQQQTRKKQAIVAVARKLLVRCWAMLRDEAPWRDPVIVAASPTAVVPISN